MFRNFEYDRVTGRGSVEAHGADVSVVNGLRRVLQTDIQYIAFRGEPFEKTTITIEKNTGPLHNEFIAHRISLLPIHFPLADIPAYEDGDLEFEVSVANKESGMRAVTTDDLVMRLRGEVVPTRQFFPLDPVTAGPVVITHLRKNEEFVAKGRAVKGTGRDHAGFCPVSLCTYRFMEAPEAAAIADPLLKERTFLKNEHGEAVAFLFQLESECGHSFHDTMLYGFDTLLQKIQKHLDSPPVPTVDSKTVSGDFVFPNEDDTLGNLFGLCFNKFIREAKKFKGKPVTYIGSYCPHPLELKMVHRACIENGTAEDYQDLIREELRIIHAAVLDARNQFAEFSGAAAAAAPAVVAPEPEAEIVEKAKPAAAVATATATATAALEPEAVVAVATAPLEVVAEFFASKNVPKTEELVLPVVETKLVNMRLADRLAMVLKDYKVNRKPHVVVMNGEVGALPWSFAQRFNTITAVEKDAVLREAMEKNLAVLRTNGVKAKGAVTVSAEAPKGEVDMLVFNYYNSALSVEKMVAEVTKALKDIQPGYVVLLSPKRVEPAALQPKMRTAGWFLYMKEFVLKEVKLTVWGGESSSEATDE